MTFVLDTHLPLPDALSAVATAQIAGALREVSGEAPDVHEVRKHCKRLRAWMRLLQPALGEDYGIANRLLRDAARSLSAYRDASVADDTLRKLRSRRLTPAERSELRRQLDTYALSRQAGEDLDASAQRAGDLLTGARAYLRGTRLALLQCPALAQGYADGYERARRGWIKACESAHPSAEQLHEWRKRVKAHAYQSELLSELWPAVAGERIGRLKQLGDVLGAHHDLDALMQALDASPAKASRDRLQRLSDIVHARQARLCRQALDLGRALFEQERPGLPALRLTN